MLQIKNLAKRVFHSPPLRNSLATACAKTGIKPLEMVRAVDTRWNTVSMTLSRALALKPGLQILVAMPEHTRPKSARLQRFRLSTSEWALLAALFPMLDVRSIVFITLLIESLSNIIFRCSSKPLKGCRSRGSHSCMK